MANVRATLLLVMIVRVILLRLTIAPMNARFFTGAEKRRGDIEGKGD